MTSMSIDGDSYDINVDRLQWCRCQHRLRLMASMSVLIKDVVLARV